MALLFSGAAVQAAIWIVPAGDEQWDNPVNWVGGTLPATGEDVIVPAGARYLFVNSSVTVGALKLPSAATLIVRGVGTQFRAAGAVSMDGANLSVQEGASLSLPGLKQYSSEGFRNDYARWSADGAGSVIELNGLTELVGSADPWWLAVNVTGGARMTMGGEFNVLSGGIYLRASDGSVLDVPGLRRLAPNFASIEARTGGRISLQNLSEYSAANGDRDTMYWYANEPGSLIVAPGLTTFTGSPLGRVTAIYALGGAKIQMPGPFKIVGGATRISVDGRDSAFEAPQLSSIAPRSFGINVTAGGHLSLPGLHEWSGDELTESSPWSSNGAGSLLELPALTGFTGGVFPWVVDIQAYNGGKTVLGGKFDYSTGGFRFSANGANSVIEAPGLEHILARSFTIQADAGAKVLLSGLKEYAVADDMVDYISWNADGEGSEIRTALLTKFSGSPRPAITILSAQNGGKITLEGAFDITGGALTLQALGSKAALDAPGLHSAAGDQVSFFAHDGGVVSLQNFSSYSAANSHRGGVGWDARGEGSVLNLPSLATFVGSPYPWSTTITAGSGGTVRLGGALRVDGGGVAFLADGTNSLLEATALRRLAANYSELVASAGGHISLSGLEEYSDGDVNWGGGRWTSTGANSLLEVHSGPNGLASFMPTPPPYATYIQALAGGHLLFGGAVQIPAGVIRFSADGDGSFLEIPGLTRLAAQFADIIADHGAHILMAGLREYSGENNRRNSPWLSATAPGSLLELPALVSIIPPRAPVNMAIIADAGGQVSLSALTEINAGNINVLAQGNGSVVNMSATRRFDTLDGNGGLRAISGGTISLGSVFVARGASLEGLSAWGTPAVTNAATSTEILCGTPGLSAAVDIRPAGQPDAPWQRRARIAMIDNTYDLRRVVTLPADVEVRVSQLLADPPELAMQPGGNGMVRLTIFGQPSSSYRVDTASAVTPAVWKPSTRIVPLTHSFEQIDVASDSPVQFLRVTKQ